MAGASPPRNITQLNERLAEVAEGLVIPVARARVMLCTLVVAQMLPEAVAVKGGMGIKLRLGESGTRATWLYAVRGERPAVIGVRAAARAALARSIRAW
ncbi:hypothetical protein GCG21_11850 [Pseudactinotalea sp. HY160]|nr:hypothetical protein [Pseudactinotalea sp. HY160]